MITHYYCIYEEGVTPPDRFSKEFAAFLSSKSGYIYKKKSLHNLKFTIMRRFKSLKVKYKITDKNIFIEVIKNGYMVYGFPYGRLKILNAFER